MTPHSPAKRSNPPAGLPAWHEARWALQKLCNELTDQYGKAMEDAVCAALRAGIDLKELHWRYESGFVGGRGVTLMHRDRWLAEVTLRFDEQDPYGVITTIMNGTVLTPVVYPR